jgi:hypothetical protein
MGTNTGHSLQVLISTYAHEVEEALRRAAERMNKIITAGGRLRGPRIAVGAEASQNDNSRMMKQNPIACVGLLSYADPGDGGPISILGTCGAFRQPHLALTAAHVVRDVPMPTRIRIDYPDFMRGVGHVLFHPDADVAILVSPPDSDDNFEGYPKGAFANFVQPSGLGEDVSAYGFPVEGPGTDPGGQVPTPRLFRGHYQRFFNFDSPAGYSYTAGELSIPAPAGLSGGPVFRPEAPSLITGIVTTNSESYSTLDWQEETHGEMTRVEAHHRVISYGLVAILSPLEEWLDQHIPHRKGTAWNP